MVHDLKNYTLDRLKIAFKNEEFQILNYKCMYKVIFKYYINIILDMYKHVLYYKLYKHYNSINV